MNNLEKAKSHLNIEKESIVCQLQTSFKKKSLYFITTPLMQVNFISLNKW